MNGFSEMTSSRPLNAIILESLGNIFYMAMESILAEERLEDRYDYVKTIGKGAYGEVNLCVDRYSGNQVALKSIKVMSNEHGLPKAIFREMETLKQLSDCNYIVKLLNTLPDGRNVCLVLEYLPSDLSELIAQSREHLPKGIFKSYAQMILKALNYCHSRHIIHRDLKPSSKAV
jgi:serine/threonine protein kinase